MEEEIDLRPYIRALFRSWYWILSAALLAGGVAYWANSLLPDVYKAEAIVAIVRERTNVSFDISIETQEDVLGSRDVRSRLDGLVALVTSSDIAVQTLAEIGPDLDENYQNAPALIGAIEASSTGDLIIIAAKYPDPEMASRIANAWAQAYVSHVNAIYVSGTNPEEEAAIAEQVAVAAGDYEAVKANLATFVANNRITFLQNEIAAQEELLISYQAARNKVQSNPIDFQVNTRQEVLVNYYADLGNIELWLTDARALREQVLAGDGSTAAQIGNALALISLRNRIFGGSGETVILQLDLSGETLDPVQLADIDTVIDVLEASRVETLAQIEAFSLSFASVEPKELVIGDDHPISQRIIELNDNILTLRAELAVQTSKQRELDQARDLAWETYDLLIKRQKEIEIASTSTGTEVQVASNSTVPGAPAGASRLLLALVAGIVGSMVAVFAVVVANWWFEPMTESAQKPLPLEIDGEEPDGKRKPVV
ncbi:MAG: hypothetical protein GY805_38720 [Chloroflexi bacterium]|nr:hypothetical protein [Chloroflexota bacterium]